MTSISDTATATLPAEWSPSDPGAGSPLSQKSRGVPGQFGLLLQSPSPSLPSDPLTFTPTLSSIAEADESIEEILCAFDGGIIPHSNPAPNAPLGMAYLSEPRLDCGQDEGRGAGIKYDDVHVEGARPPFTAGSGGRGIPGIEFGLTYATPAAILDLGLGAGGNISTTGETAVRKFRNIIGHGKTGPARPSVVADTEGDLQLRRTGGLGVLDLNRLASSYAEIPATEQLAADASPAADDHGEPRAPDAGLPGRLGELSDLRDRLRDSIDESTAKREAGTPAAASPKSANAWAADRASRVGERSQIVAEIEPALAEVNRLLQEHADHGQVEIGDLKTLQCELTHMAIVAEFGVNADAAADALVAVQQRLGPSDFPLGTTLRAMGDALPSLREWAGSADPVKQHAATASLDALAAMIEDGEHLDFVLGRDAALNTAFLPLRQAHAERRAVANLCARHLADGRAPPTDQEQDAVRGPARDAAALRLELSNANRQLERLLTTDRRVLLRPSTWGETGAALGDGSASVLRKDGAFLNALRKRGGSGAGRDLALLIARISDLERRTLPLEKKVLGLHPQLNLDDLAGPDPEQPLAHIGISSDDLAAMGLDRVTMDQINGRAIELNNQGLASVQDVVRTNKVVHDVADSVFRNTLSQETIGTFAEQLPAQRQRLRDELLASAAPATSAGALPAATDPDVVAHFRGQAAAAKAGMLGDTGDASHWDGLRDSAAQYRRAESKIAIQMNLLRNVDRRLDRARQILTTGMSEHGRRLDPNKPQGLQSAKAILAALDADEALRRDGPDARLQAERDAALDKLKGLDTLRMHRPWQQKAAASIGLRVRPSIAELEGLRPRAEAIVLMRETAPRDKSAARARIAQQGAIMDQILTQRRDDDPVLSQWARQTVRAAVLASWPNEAPDRGISDGVATDGFNPAAHRDGIEALLRKWGLETDRFAPEIDEVLHGPIGPTQLSAWRREAAIPFADPGHAATATPSPGNAAAEVLLHRRDMDGATKAALRSIIGSMQSGDALNLRTGQRITLDSNKIPLEASGLMGLRARLAAANVAECEIERGSSDYKLHLRRGGEGKANLDFIAGRAFGRFGKFEAAAGAEGSHARTAGATLMFGNDDRGREALVELIDKMAGGQTVGASDWADAKSVALGRVNTTKAAVNARANVRGEFTAAPNPAIDKQGVGLSLEATATAAGAVKQTEIRNLNERVRKGSAEISVNIRANASFYAQLYSAANAATGLPLRGGPQDRTTGLFGTANAMPGGSPNYNISSGTANSDLLGASIGATAICTRKWKQVVDADNHISDAEIVRQTNVRSGAVSAMSTVATYEMRRRIQDNPDFGRSVGAMLRLMRKDDVLSITYGIKPAALRQANALLDEAATLRRHGAPARADALNQRARSIIDDAASYQPVKISLLSTAVDKQQATNLNMRFLRWETYSDGKTEHPAVELDIPPGKAP